MTAKSFTFSALIALLAFFIGLYVGKARTPAPAAAAPGTSTTADPHVAQLASLREDNDRLRADAATMQTNLSRLTEANAKLEAHAAEVLPRKSLALGMSRGEVQEAVLNNLRQIGAARDQFYLENGRSPGNLAALVGRKAYIRRMLIVDGEDYSGLSMESKAPLTVQTPGGLAITFDPAGTNTTKPEFTPEEQAERVEQERTTQIMRASQKAVAAYQKAHGGDQPPNPQAIIPYFEDPKTGADFVEFLEAQKARKK